MDSAAAATDLRLSTPLSELPDIGPKRAQLFRRLGLATVKDLLLHLPLRYERHWAEGAIGDLPMEGIGSARGTVVNTRTVPSRGGGRFQATLQDHSDRLNLVWFNGGYLRTRIHPGMVLRVQGKTKAFGGYPQMVNPQWEELREPDEAAAQDERYRPVYPATESLPSSLIERLATRVVPAVLDQVIDPLPEVFLRERNMPSLAQAFRMAHIPANPDEAAAARRRLAFNECLLLQLGIALKRHHNRTHLRAPALRWSKAVDEHIRGRFPFKLTAAQERVAGEIAADLQRDQPMNRLLQGDVGSGKTVVALYALLMAVAGRRQGEIMTPTELLAEQHHLSISTMLVGSNVRIGLLTGGQSAAGSAQRRELLDAIEAGQIDIVIGTQALLTEAVRFNDLAVVVVDEQHRFGVLQRAAFRERNQDSRTAGQQEIGAKGESRSLAPAATRGSSKGANGGLVERELAPAIGLPVAPGGGDIGERDARPTSTEERRRSPHYLVMTATPIPRTLSLTIFGDLDVSTIDALPPGRTPITTRVVGQDKADEVYRYMAGRVAKSGGGEQAYVVVPTIDATGQESAQQLKSVAEHAKLLQEKYCQGVRVAALHGRMKVATREAVMRRFRAGEVGVLVATTVIEVGVDVPNATLMIVEHAERFGLAQLHQLRGRIGRKSQSGGGGHKSLCVFIAEAATEEAARRVKAIAATTDGFKIAEADLAIRGMGDFFGTRQSGQMPLRVARIPEDLELLQLARKDAMAMVAADPALADPSRQLLRKVLIQQYGDTLGLIDVG
jgi:ATP-dependent DNA helicase RecG